MDFPGDPAVNSPPANAGDTYLIHGLGRFHMPQDDWAKIAEPATPESLCSATREAAPEKPQLESGPCSPQLERALCTEHKTHCSQKWIIKLPLKISLVQPCCRKNNGPLKCPPPSPHLLRKCCLPWQSDFADEIKDPEIGRYPGWSSWDWVYS